MNVSVKEQLRIAYDDPRTSTSERESLVYEAAVRQRRHNRRAPRTAAYESLQLCRRFYPWRVTS